MPLGELITRWMIRLALLLCAAAWGLRLGSAQRDSTAVANDRSVRLSRVLWTLGFLFYLVHVAAAFHFYHAWSHAAAWQHTAERTHEVLGIDWGGGVWFNYVFTLAWALDVAWQWKKPIQQVRPRWVTISWYTWFVAIVFFATVVFETGATRWVAVGVLTLLTFAGASYLSSRPRL